MGLGLSSCVNYDEYGYDDGYYGGGGGYYGGVAPVGYGYGYGPGYYPGYTSVGFLGGGWGRRGYYNDHHHHHHHGGNRYTSRNRSYDYSSRVARANPDRVSGRTPPRIPTASSPRGSRPSVSAVRGSGGGSRVRSAAPRMDSRSAPRMDSSRGRSSAPRMERSAPSMRSGGTTASYRSAPSGGRGGEGRRSR